MRLALPCLVLLALLPSDDLLGDETPLGDDLGQRAVVARVRLSAASWTRNGEATDRRASAADAPVRLPFDAMGVRWATRFVTHGPATFRLALDWDPGPEGLLFEIILDGEFQRPPRDGWRPSARHLLSDLGPRWLGDGEHLLEFVARESADEAALHLRELRLLAP